MTASRSSFAEQLAFATPRIDSLRLLRAVALVALGGAPLACSAPAAKVRLGELQAAVRGGHSALVCEWPAVAGLDLGCSATLVHPEVVVYAAHCGEGIGSVAFGEDLALPERVVETRRCVAHPDAALGNGFDVAFCILAEPVEDIPTIPIAAGCELAGVRAGTAATVVGFGPAGEGSSFGVKRSAQVTLGSIAADLVVSANTSASCSGDSGGPLLIAVQSSSQVGASQQRLVGVVSAADRAECAPSEEHYSYLPPLLPWLERESGRDLTPCFAADGSWNPTPNCNESASQQAGGSWSTACRASARAPDSLATCGEAFAPELLFDATPPELELLPAAATTHLVSEGGAAETSLEASASDAESGVAEVRFELRDERGRPRAEERDEVPPYVLERLRLPPGSWEVLVTARDHAFNERQERRSFVVTTAGEATAGDMLPGDAPAGDPSAGDNANCALSATPVRCSIAVRIAALALAAFGARRRGTKKHDQAQGLLRRHGRE